MKKLCTILLSVLLAACGYDDFGNFPAGSIPGVDAFPNADLSILYTHYYGEPFIIEEDMIFEGYIVADDASGNFFRSFIIEDETGAAEILAGYYDLHSFYCRGRRILVHAKGLAVGIYNGLIQVGVRIDQYTPYRVEEFGARAVLDKYVERDIRQNERSPFAIEIGELDKAMCGRLVKIGRVQRTEDSPLQWAQPESEGVAPQTGTVVFRDGRGDSISVVTSGYASFAGEQVPSDSIALAGILIYGKFGGTAEKFVLKLRDTDDVER